MIEFRPIEPMLFTAAEAAAYLRLTDDGRDIPAAVKALNRLVTQDRLRPCLVGRHRRYSRVELDQFITRETEKYGELP